MPPRIDVGDLVTCMRNRGVVVKVELDRRNYRMCDVRTEPGLGPVFSVPDAWLRLIGRPGVCPTCGRFALLARRARERTAATTSLACGLPWPDEERFEIAGPGRTIEPMVCVACLGRAAAVQGALVAAE